MRIDGLAPTTVAAFAVALSVEKGFAEAHAETGSKWPEGCCVESSLALAEELQERVPDAGAEYVWGQFEARGALFGHAWVALADETILDLTLGQFYREGPALALVTTDSPVRHRYREQVRGAPSGDASADYGTRAA